MTTKASFNSDALKEIDKILDQVSVFQHAPIFKKAIRDAGNVMKKRYQALVPTSGSPADDGITPLARAISIKVKDTDNGVMAIIGEKQNTQFHAHLIEAPHRIVTHGKTVGSTTGTPYGEMAKEQSQSQMDSVLIESVRKAANELGK